MAGLLDNSARVGGAELGSLASIQTKQCHGVRMHALRAREELWGAMERREFRKRAQPFEYLEGPRGVVPTQPTPVPVDVHGSHS